MAALLEHIDVSGGALLENDNSVSQDLRRRAANRLTTVPVYRRDEAAAISRIRREVLGSVLHLWSSVTKTTQPSRSEEHTAELQSLRRTSYAVFCLKKTKPTT